MALLLPRFRGYSAPSLLSRFFFFRRPPFFDCARTGSSGRERRRICLYYSFPSVKIFVRAVLPFRLYFPLLDCFHRLVIELSCLSLPSFLLNLVFLNYLLRCLRFSQHLSSSARISAGGSPSSCLPPVVFAPTPLPLLPLQWYMNRRTDPPIWIFPDLANFFLDCFS